MSGAQVELQAHRFASFRKQSIEASGGVPGVFLRSSIESLKCGDCLVSRVTQWRKHVRFLSEDVDDLCGAALCLRFEQALPDFFRALCLLHRFIELPPLGTCLRCFPFEELRENMEI